MDKMVDIVIVNYRVPLFVAQVLFSLQAIPADTPRTIWVVDNHSEDNSTAYLKKLFPEVNFIENSRNGGFAEANNIAIRASSAPYVLLLNPDTLVGESTLSRCIEVMEKYPTCGAVGAKLIDARGNFLPECRRYSVSLWSTFCKLSGLSKRFPKSRLFNRYYMGYRDESLPSEVGMLCGAFMLMRREALEKVGLLDERYFMYGEDIDLCYAMKKAGYSIRYQPTPVLHYKGESESAAFNPQRYNEAFYGAMGLFYEKYHPKNTFTKHIIKRLLQQKIKRATTLSPQRGKEIPSLSHTEGKAYRLDLNKEIPNLSSIPRGSFLIVEPTAGIYDKLLVLLESCRGKGLTLITYYPKLSTKGLQPTFPLIQGVALGPGGLCSDLFH